VSFYGTHIIGISHHAHCRHGAEVVSQSASTSTKKTPAVFTGVGYKLGESETEPGQAVPGLSVPKHPVSKAQQSMLSTCVQS